jgi:hypothetical protein
MERRTTRLAGEEGQRSGCLGRRRMGLAGNLETGPWVLGLAQEKHREQEETIANSPKAFHGRRRDCGGMRPGGADGNLLWTSAAQSEQTRARKRERRGPVASQTWHEARLKAYGGGKTTEARANSMAAVLRVAALRAQIGAMACMC